MLFGPGPGTPRETARPERFPSHRPRCARPPDQERSCKNNDQHASPIKNWKQLVVVVVFAFIVPIAVAVLISQYVTSGSKGMHEDESAIIKRIQPVGEVVLAAPSGPKGQLTGEQVYGQVCKNCHEAGLAGAPKFGDKTAWAKVIAQGQPVAVDHALKGIRAMPAKGGNPDLENVEVERAVAYMANKGGANWKEPPTIAPLAVTASSERTGEQVVQATCGKCHQTGEGGAPKIGDRAAWRERAKGGYKAVLRSALKGHAGMPARGGMAELSDVEIEPRGPVHDEFGRRQADRGGTRPRAGRSSTSGRFSRAGRRSGETRRQEDLRVDVHGLSRRPGLPVRRNSATRRRGRRGSRPGIDTLYQVALKGKGAMPPKGGNKALPDADVKAAVDYMVAAAK